MNKKLLLKAFLAVNILLCIIFFYDFMIFINLILPFYSVIVIVFGTILGYRQNIQKRVELENSLNTDSFQDENDNYKEDVKISNFEAVKKSSTANFAFLRIVGYVLFVGSFMYLNNNGILNVFVFLAGVTILPLFLLVVNFFSV